MVPVSFDRDWPIETGTTNLACLAFLPTPPIPNTRQVRHQSWRGTQAPIAAPQELHLVHRRPLFPPEGVWPIKTWIFADDRRPE